MTAARYLEMSMCHRVQENNGVLSHRSQT